MLAPFYDDLDDNQGIEPFDVFAYQDDSNQRFIIQWENVANGQHDEDCIPGDDEFCPKETFQLILLPNGNILFQYKNVNDVDDHGCTIGIESPNKNEGVEYIFYNQQHENASVLTNELAILFMQNNLNISNNSIPTHYFISKNFPNPFNPSTTIQYNIPHRAEVRITIFDHQGREVIQLVNNIINAGVNFVEWNGRNQSGMEVSSGIYFYQVSWDDFVQSGKMLLVR
jgi:hypothetical protein